MKKISNKGNHGESKQEAAGRQQNSVPVMKQMEVLERGRKSPEVVSVCSLQYIRKLLPGEGIGR